jgi:hypothetical protein
MKNALEWLKTLNIKNILGASVFTILGFLTNNWFKDRKVSIEEMNEYERYLTETLVLNDHPAKKRMLAQYFASVTPSGFQNSNWEDYLCLVERDYYKFKIQDSLDRKRYISLLDKSNLTNGEKWEKDVLETKLNTLIKKQNEDVKMPDSEPDKTLSIYIQYEKKALEKAKGISNTLDSLGYNVQPLDLVEGINESDIRFFADSHSLIVKGIAQKLLEKYNLKFKEKNFKILAKNGIPKSVEIWIAE